MAPLIAMLISVYNKQKDLSIDKKSVQDAVASLLNHRGIATDHLAVHFVSSKSISSLHKKLFDDPSTTDCISLPMDPPDAKDTPYHVLGEIFVCPATAMDYATARGKNPHEEVLLYIVHGLLHLLGYDDLSTEERKIMRKEEQKSLRKLKHICLDPKKNIVLNPPKRF